MTRDDMLLKDTVEQANRRDGWDSISHIKELQGIFDFSFQNIYFLNLI